jgi:hypothetical protein
VRPGPSLTAKGWTETALPDADCMSPRFITWIWHIRGSLALAPGLSSDDAFDRLDPLFHQTGTSRDRTNDTLTFQKKDQAAQDKMSVFDGGVLRIEKGVAGPTLRYHLTSRALLFCFLAPLLFLALAQITIAANNFYAPGTSAADKLAAAKAEEKKKAADEKMAKMPMNPIDKALGAPAPKKPGTEDKGDEDKKKPTPTPAYVFAGIFAALYIVGRILEDRLIKSLFKKRLLSS